MEELISTLVWAAIIQGVLLVGLYFFSKKHKSLANRLLGLFLLAIIYEATLQFLLLDNIFGYPINYYFSLPEVKLFYPLLFLHYILEKVGRTKHYWKILRLHYFLAFALAGVFMLNILLFVFNGNKFEDYFSENTIEFFFMAQQYYAFILIIAGLIVAVKEIKYYKLVVQEEYSDYRMLNINWLWQFIFAILPIVFLWGAELIRILLGGINESKIISAIWFFVVIFIYFVSFQAFKQKNLFEEIARGSELTIKGKQKKGKRNQLIHEPNIKEKELELIRKIKRYMETHEPYLNASLSMHQLAKQLDIPTHELSQLINHKLNKHFFDFVNEYRVNKAMGLLRNPQNSKMTVLEILYEVGFNSKSSFNAVFKKNTGKTPTQYRKSTY